MIRDNASSDWTLQVVTDFIQDVSGITDVDFASNPTNIGMIPNVFSLFEASKSPHMIFIGDDDELELEGLTQLLTYLRENPGVGHVIQGKWPWRPEPKEFEPLQLWTYEAGLAWSCAYRVDSVVHTLSNSEQRRYLEGNIWGQIGLILLSEGKPFTSKIVNLTWGKVAQNRPYEYDYELLLVSLRDLLRVHVFASRALDRPKIARQFAAIRNPGFRNHVLGVVVQASRLRVNYARAARDWNQITLELKSIRASIMSRLFVQGAIFASITPMAPVVWAIRRLGLKSR